MYKKCIVGALCVLLMSGCEKLDINSSAERGEGNAVKVRFKGRIGEKFDALVRERCLSKDALGKFYEETVNAFRTHYDDTHQPGQGYWQNEYWGKYTLSLLAGAKYSGDENLKKEVIEKSRRFVEEFQRPDGAITTYKNVEFVQPSDKERRRMCWNLWGRKYTLWALLEVYRVSGDEFFLNAASRLIDQQIEMLERLNLSLRDTGCFSGLPSLSVLKPVLILYRESGNVKYLEYAKSIVGMMDDPDPSNPAPNLVRNAFSDKPIYGRYAPKAPLDRMYTKAYEMMSCYEGLVEYSRITGERRPLEATLRTADQLVKEELNAMGSVGYFDRFAETIKYANGISEYCDVIHWIRLCGVLYAETGDVKHMDRLEKAFFNAGLAGFYRDGKWVTHGVRSHGFGHFPAPCQVGMSYHQCCVDNAPRLIGTIADVAVREMRDGSLEVNMYQDLGAEFADGKLEISGNYPVNDKVTLSIDSKKPRTIRLRVPSWCSAMAVNGKIVKGPFAVLPAVSCKKWNLEFEMRPRVVNCKLPVETNAENIKMANNLFTMAGFKPPRISPLRRERAAYVVKGPLVLAKTALLGDTEKEIFDFVSVNGKDATAELEPLKNTGVTWGAWKLILTTPDGKQMKTKVSDYATAADDDISTAFSIWF